MKLIPNDNEVRKAWLSKIKRDGKLPKRIYICSEHFTEDCLERDLKKEFSSGSIMPIYKIKDNAVPSIFSFSKHTPERAASVRR